MANTDSYIRGLYNQWNNPSSPGGALVTRAELIGVIDEMLQQVNLTDLGTPVEGFIPKVVGGVWTLAPDQTADAGTGVDADATITAHRVWQMGDKSITLKKGSPNDTPSLIFETDITSNSHTTHWKVKSPTEYPHGRDFGLLSVVTLNPATPVDPQSYNEVAKLGFNPDRFWTPEKNGFWDAWEPHWISGDALYLERHISVDAAAFPGENRLYSILTILRDSWATSDIVHLWKGTSYNWKDQSLGSGADLMTLAKNGNGSKLTISPFVLETDPTNNILNFYPSTVGGTLDFGANKWSRYRFRGGKLNAEFGTYTSSVNAVAFGLQSGDVYKKADGSLWVVD